MVFWCRGCFLLSFWASVFWLVFLAAWFFGVWVVGFAFFWAVFGAVWFGLVGLCCGSWWLVGFFLVCFGVFWFCMVSLFFGSFVFCCSVIMCS